MLQCKLRIPSRFPHLTKGAICRWGILISRDIKIPHPNYFMFLCSKLIWRVFWGHRIVSKSACLIKNVHFLFWGKFDGPDYSCQTSKLSGSIRMKRRKSLYIVQLSCTTRRSPKQCTKIWAKVIWLRTIINSINNYTHRNIFLNYHQLSKMH